MITTTLNALRQTQHLGASVSTGAYDDGELETLLNEPADSRLSRVRGTQPLSQELMAQILAGEFASSNPNGGGGKFFSCG